MTEWLAALRDRAGAVPLAMVSVLACEGSAPRGAGTRMLVTAESQIGTIGGGHLELLAIENARTLLARVPDFEPVDRHYPLGPALGQCCGGAVTLRFARLDTSIVRDWPAAAPRFVLQLYGAGHVGRAIDGNPYIRRMQRWCIVDAVTHEADDVAEPSQSEQDSKFLLRIDPAKQVDLG